MRLTKVETLKKLSDHRPRLTTADFPLGCLGRKHVEDFLWSGMVELTGPNNEIGLTPAGEYMLKQALEAIRK